MSLWPNSLRSRVQRCSGFFSCAALCFGPFRAQRQANAEIERDRREDQREPCAMDGLKMFTQSRDDFMRPVDMFALNEPVVALVVAIFEQALSRDLSREPVSQAPLAWDDH